ncbi:hypothetical protein OMO38_02315 [Chryseobacterium sp. 09-1422]|uniref:Uncharacterized protein n=1 Tax=Chryseobacterium kimseyorum TaxID=2984028 RepID=A0ABT3HU92_9FLAO|nr:hypothetical protein [Chryseobacterium kimseyorum]MCW3167352.1 hypothetical protein [Chryseobacterium kimseyorum]
MEIYLAFGTLIFLFILGNLAFHNYNKNKHEKFLASLSGKGFIKLNSINTDIDISSSNSIYNYQINKSTIILLNDHIFLLIKSKIFNVAQPILQISRIENRENFAYIWEKINYISKQKADDKIRIKGYSKRGLAKIDYRIILDFSGKKCDLIYFKF